ncbi:MAG: hypothetical protein AAGU05_11505, partial [Anaerolineaceae bacterium]
YTLSRVVSPEPNQVISLALDIPEPSITATGTPSATEVPTFKVGDTLPLRTGIILDHNHNPVPDGTEVQFLFTTGRDNAVVQQITSKTMHGVAKAAFRIQNPGIVEIRAVSAPAMTSQILSLDVSGEQAAAVTAIVPTAQIEPTPTLAPTSSPTPEATPEPVAPNGGDMGLVRWLTAVMFTWLCAAGIYNLGRARLSLRWGVRWALLSAAGGLAVYSLGIIILDTEGSWFTQNIAGTIFLALCGVLLGWAAGIFWQRRMKNASRSGG